jgi:hypothetical protein
LALRQAVDLIVEQQHLQIDVAAHHVDEVIAADRQAVAVARHEPNGKLRPHSLDAGRDRRRAPVDAVDAVGLHVIRKPTRAADAADEHDLLARNAEARHDALDLGQDRVVTATRAPADFLIRHEVLARQRTGIGVRNLWVDAE